MTLLIRVRLEPCGIGPISILSLILALAVLGVEEVTQDRKQPCVQVRGGSAAFGAARQLRTHDLCLAVALNGLKHYQSYCPPAEGRRSRAERHGRRSAPELITPEHAFGVATISVRLGR
jgi:hypothetical protein